MLKILGSTSSPAASAPTAGSRIDLDADRGTGVAAAATAAQDALQRESSSGVEWLPRHAPHRRI